METFLADSVALQVGDLQSAASLNTVADLEAAVRLIAKGRRVAFLGLRASFAPAYQFHYAYNLIFPNGVLLQDQGGTLLDQLGELDHRDVLIAISLAPYTTQTVRAVERAAAQGVTVLALTDSRLSPLATPAAQALLFQAESLSFFQSMTGVLGLLELLLALLAAQGGRPVLERIARMEAQLKQSQAYWDARHTRPRPKPLAAKMKQPVTRRPDLRNRKLS